MKGMLTTLLLLLIVSSASAQDPGAGVIVLSADPLGESCSIYPAGGLVTIHAVIKDSTLLLGCRFLLSPVPPSMFLVTTSTPYLDFGDPHTTGITLTFNGGAFGPPLHVLTLSYLVTSNVPPCTLIEVLPHPAMGEIVTVDYFFDELTASGRGIMINPTPDCDDCSEIPIANEYSTWGSVKGLYAN